MQLKKFLNFVSIFLLIGTSGIPFFMGQIQLIFLGLVLAIFCFLGYTDRKLDKKFIVFILTIFILQVLQGMYFGEIYWSTYLGLIVRFVWGYLVIKNSKTIFCKKYVQIMYFFSVISLFFYAGMVLIPNSRLLFEKVAAPFGFYVFKPAIPDPQTFHIIIYNFHGYKYEKQSNEDLAMLRNCGPFWEPGAYVGFLVFALFFLYVVEGSIKNRKGAVFIIALITTFSTTGYLALFIALYIFLKEEFRRFRWVVIPVLIFLTYFAFFNLAFLNDKIEAQQDMESDHSRFGSATRDLAFFYRYPLLGAGRSADSEYGKAVSGENQTNNGITSTMAGMGGLYFFTFCGLMIYSYYKVGSHYKRDGTTLFFAVFLVISFSETYPTIPFFMSLAFLYILTIDNPVYFIKGKIKPKYTIPSMKGSRQMSRIN